MAYQDALEYEPDNPVTQAYLEKTKTKLEKQRSKESPSVFSVDSTVHTPSNLSVVTDAPRTGVVQNGYRGMSSAMARAAIHRSPDKSPAAADGEDPDFDEALRIQQRANKYLSKKQYKAAIEEYTAALFLVPDDPGLSPDLHLGRAHALNGSRRHESAKNDAIMALRLNPRPAAYSTLAKSLYYMRDYRGSVEAFEKCLEMDPELGMFDKAYLQKARAALEEEEASLLAAGTPSRQTKSPVPKLPPPRFVPREEALQQTPVVPSMPKQWPQQSPRSPTSFVCGPERKVVFLSESLGVKLNRGSDGIVRVLSVAESSVARNGEILIGDVVREAAGVDIRRPITNIMWGDTVALIKMAPRPITFVVAQELSEVPPAVLDEQKKLTSPSRANGDEAVSKCIVCCRAEILPLTHITQPKQRRL